MKVKEKQLENGMIRLSITATPQEVNAALDRAQGAIASRFGLRPDPTKSVTEALAEHLKINDADSVLQSQAINMLVPYALDQRGITPLAQPKIQPSPGFMRDHAFSFQVDVEPQASLHAELIRPRRDHGAALQARSRSMWMPRYAQT